MTPDCLVHHKLVLEQSCCDDTIEIRTVLSTLHHWRSISTFAGTRQYKFKYAWQMWFVIANRYWNNLSFSYRDLSHFVIYIHVFAMHRTSLISDYQHIFSIYK